MLNFKKESYINDEFFSIIMLWQDIVITIANLMFTFSIFHQVYHGFKLKKGFITLTTSSLSCLGLFSMAIAVFSLKLYLSSVFLSINAVLWLMLFFQRLVYRKV